MSHSEHGWEVLHKLYEKEVAVPEDLLVLFVHWCLTKNGFRCIGLGSESIYDETETGSELLPTGWNQAASPEGVSLRYVIGGKLFVLRAFSAENRFIFNLLRIQDYSVASMLFVPEDVVIGLRGSLVELMPNYKSMLRDVHLSLVTPLYTGDKHDRETQTLGDQSSAPRRGDSLLRQDHDWDTNYARNLIENADSIPNLLRDLRNVGRADMDPMTGIGHGGGRGMGGGMIFTPPGNRGLGVRDPSAGIPGGLPRGAVPPGARFDPFGPPNPNRGGGGPNRFGAPDPDHLPPPGYDDMFM